MLPEHLVVEFWDTVLRELRDRHELGDCEARGAIAEYKDFMQKHEVGEIVYHREPESVAETIAASKIGNHSST